jgi:hypothetical protein
MAPIGMLYFPSFPVTIPTSSFSLKNVMSAASRGVPSSVTTPANGTRLGPSGPLLQPDSGANNKNAIPQIAAAVRSLAADMLVLSDRQKVRRVAVDSPG